MLLNNGQTISLAPQALGETTPIAATGFFYPKSGLPLLKEYATYGHLYRSQPWVFTVVDKIASAIARLNLLVWDDQPNTAKNLDTSSRYAKLISQPTGFLSNYRFWHWVVSTYEIYGEVFILKERDGNGNVVGLLPFHPSRVSVERAARGGDWKGAKSGDVRYIFTAGTASAGLITAPEEDVIPWLRYNPDGLMRGWSRLEPLRSTLMNEDASRRAQSAWWQNMGRPSMTVSVDGKIDSKTAKRVRADFDNIHAGADNVGGTLVLPAGMTAIQTQMNADEMAYIESRKLNRGEVAAVYDIPPPCIQILDNATFSNITEQMRSLYRDALPPRIEDLESTLDRYLGAEFQGKKVARFAVDAVLRGDVEVRAETAVSLVSGGIAKPSEVRPWFDLNDAGPSADRLYANSAIQELGSVKEYIAVSGPTAELVPETPEVAQNPPQHALPPAPGTAPANSPAGASSPVVNTPSTTKPPKVKPGKFFRTVMANVGNGKSFDDVRRRLLTNCPAHDLDELLADLDMVEKRTR